MSYFDEIKKALKDGKEVVTTGGGKVLGVVSFKGEYLVSYTCDARGLLSLYANNSSNLRDIIVIKRELYEAWFNVFTHGILLVAWNTEEDALKQGENISAYLRTIKMVEVK